MPSTRMFRILSRRQAQKVVLRLDVRLGRPRRKLRFLHAASKDLDGQQVCTVGDHAEEAAQVPSTIEQQHEGLSGKFAHRVRMVHEQSVQRLGQNPASQEIRDQKPGVHKENSAVRVRQGALVDTHVIHDRHEHGHSRRRSWVKSKAVVNAGANTGLPT